MLSKTVDFNPNSSTSAHLWVNQMNSFSSNVVTIPPFRGTSGTARYQNVVNIT